MRAIVERLVLLEKFQLEKLNSDLRLECLISRVPADRRFERISHFPAFAFIL